MDNITEIETLFRKHSRKSHITYNEFLEAGWTKEDYFEYLRRCVVIYSGLIFFHQSYIYSGYCNTYYYNKKLSPSAIDSIEEELAPVFSELEQLGEWLQQFFTSKIDSLKQYFNNLGGLIAYMERDFFNTPLSNAAPIYVDIDTFRRYLERYIYRCLPPDNYDDSKREHKYSSIEEINTLLGDNIEALTEEEINDKIWWLEEGELDFFHTVNESDIDYNQYTSIQQCAKKIVDDENIYLEYENAISLLQDELEERKNRKYLCDDDVIVLEQTPFNCYHQGHQVKDVLAYIKIMIEGKTSMHKVNAGYCPDCNTYFIDPAIRNSLIKNNIQILNPLLGVDEYLSYKGLDISQKDNVNFSEESSKQTGTSNNQIERGKLLHCVDDLHLLSFRGSKKVVIKGKKYGLAEYFCPQCGRMYTSIDQLKDLTKIKLTNTKYTNLLEPNDDLRLAEYLRKPHDPKAGSRCYVYKNKPERCLRCLMGKLQTRRIRSKGDEMDPYYIVRYCQFCGYYHIHYSIYEKHKEDWILENPDDYSVFTGTVEKTVDNAGVNSSSKMTPKAATEHDNNIHLEDFVVRRNTFRCLHNGHKIKDIAGNINVIDQKGNIKQVKISAGYCSECNIFFILESTYEYLKKKGTPLCRISSEKAYLKGTGNYNGMNLQAESILMQYGYTVSQEEGLSSSRRQKILAVLIDNKVLTKNDIIGYLDFFISQKKNNHIFEKAISKWLDDREFVAEYKMGSYKEYFINGIHYKY